MSQNEDRGYPPLPLEDRCNRTGVLRFSQSIRTRIMTERFTATLHNRQQAFQVLAGPVEQFIKANMQVERRYQLTIKPMTRSLDANARLHAMLTDISRQAKYLGAKRDVAFWKGLFVSGWEIATGQKSEIVPGLEGEFINIRQSTATMSGKKCAEVMEYIEVWAAVNDVKFTAKEWE
jgi:hypothetical protein